MSDIPARQGDSAAAWTLAAVLASRRFIVGCALGVGFVVGVVILLLPRTYTSTASILPLARRSNINLAGIVASLGVNLSGADLNQTPPFYADLALTPTILIPVVNQSYKGSDSTAPAMNLKDYYHVKAGPDALRTELAVKKLLKDLHVTLKTRTGVVEMDATMKDPVLAHAVVSRILDEMNDYNVSSRQSQAASEAHFTAQRADESRDSLLAAEDRERRFLRENRGDLNASPDLRFELDRLQREVTLRQQLYTTLAQAYEQARIEEVRDTPVLTIVEPPRVPAKPDSRAVLLKLLIAMFAAGGAALLAVLAGIAVSPPGRGDPAGGAVALRDAWAATQYDVRHPLWAFRDTVRSWRNGRSTEPVSVTAP